jgi:hypothetical protein
MAAVHYVKDEENTAHRLANELQQAGHTFDIRQLSVQSLDRADL